jgi:predicted Zn-dependent protease
VFFRRILAIAALLVAAAACTFDSTGPETSVVAASRPNTLPRDIERQVGPAYDSPQLQALVERVGQKLVSDSSLPGSFHFYVLDQPIANAHALPTGYVFVTRGLLSLIDDDAELAAAMGHELGHIILKHAAERERARKGIMDAAVAAALKSGSASVGRSVARSGLLELRRYSRDQELEADKAGLGFIVKAGYRGSAMYSLIEKLRRQARLEDQLMGEASGGQAEEQSNAMSTHPDPERRMAALQQYDAVRRPGNADRAGYLALIDGMSVDDRPEEGFVRGPEFLHPTLRLAFAAPADFRLFNASDGVLGVGADRSAMFFSCTPKKIEGRLDDWMRNQIKPTPTSIQSTEIGGADAAIGARPRGEETGLSQIRYVLIRHDDGICYFNLLSDGPDRDRRIEALVAAARSFRTLSLTEAASLEPYRLHVVPRDGGTAAQFAQRMPYRDFKLARLLALNGVDSPDEFTRRTLVKLVQP